MTLYNWLLLYTKKAIFVVIFMVFVFVGFFVGLGFKPIPKPVPHTGTFSLSFMTVKFYNFIALLHCCEMSLSARGQSPLAHSEIL